MTTDYKFRNAPPRASAMIESLRGLGYSAATALADIIDNSISAKAKNVEICFFWNSEDKEKSYISIVDDGQGMDDGELERAMRLGDKSPLVDREPDDLGRFGLGLKTASFSLCRSLTVASKKKNCISCLRWDLDVLSLSQGQDWHLLEGPSEDSKILLEPLSRLDIGTIVLLEKLDRVITPGCNVQNFLDQVDQVEKHLSMVFHRFLEGPKPKLRLSINGKSLTPWDPFLSSNPLTWNSPDERFPGNISAKGYVLPHKEHLTSDQYTIAAGPEGWTSQQGFYVYRNERLLVAGSWLGLGNGRAWTKEEAHRLARIRLDIPNTADADWKINILKSTARAPVKFRDQLIHLAEDTRRRARRVFAHRVEPRSSKSNETVKQAWCAEHNSKGIRYRIDEEHPCIKAVLEEAGSFAPQIRAMLKIIEETVPVQKIWLDTAEGKDTPYTGFSNSVSDEVQSVLEIMYRNMVKGKGFSSSHAREILLYTEPFHNFPELVSSLPDIH
jgi:hypothetical protein